MSFSKILSKSQEFLYVLDCVKKNILPLSVITGATSQKAHFVYSFFKEKGENILVICPSEIEARALSLDLRFFSEDVLFYPTKDYVFYDVDTVSRSGVFDRIRVCSLLAEGKTKYITVTSIEALMQFSSYTENVKKYNIEFEIGKVFDTDELSKALVTMGYTKEDMVEGVGQFSQRGGILDVFAPNYDNPLRIEFFDDETDSIRFFDVESQTSVEKVKSAVICPCREMIYDNEEREKLKDALCDELKKLKRKKTDVESAILNLESDIEKLEEKYYFASADKYIFKLYGYIPSLLDYFSDEDFYFFDETKRCAENAKDFESNFSEGIADLMERGVIFPGNKVFLRDYKEIFSSLSEKKLIGLSSIETNSTLVRFKESVSLKTQSLNSFHGKIDFLYDDLRDWKEKKITVVILAGGEGRCKNLVTALNNINIESVYTDEFNENAIGRINVLKGSLSGGFYYPLEKFVLVSDREIFKENKRRRKYKTEDENKISSFADISPGDYVVHQVHGIGKYEGIFKMTTLGVTKDYLKISYHGTDKLYVPTTQIDMLYKYIGSTEKKVSLNRLGGADWNRAKSRVKASAADLAKYLTDLYAQRSKEKGFAFSSDTPWQRDFEDTFIYTETEDQLKCIEEVKRDMESEKPMDRLLCGDVGYGKTEVAIRAAFKAVMDSKQVAYLVPTTVLAMQHFNTFTERMKNFPIKIEMMSRFKSPAAQKETLKKLKTGEVDIVIGTHRILQKDLVFKDLGLLIVDEEQRFGVGHKEKLKEIRKNVDVLTLSATPIPRTLHMAMVNIRDMSVLNAPPENRYPVQTYVLEYDESIIKDAIRKEIGRGGQVYYLYNKVNGIYDVAERIRQMVPEAKVGVGHGQMGENSLEDVMYDVVNGDINVLVCTTIIETGLDISNVNTIIIEDADKMGLSQLYQLRGRVGRSNKMAYAYLTYRREKVLSDISQKRLSAIREFTEFGSGFKIAMRDLQIRGAGNILGAEQHGHMDSVGYDMYCRLLKEAVGELSGEDKENRIEASIDINVDAHIPESYIQNQEQRIDAYKKIAAIEEESDIYDIEEEFTDRYGDLPTPAKNVMEISLIKSMAERIKLSEISQKEENIVLKFSGKEIPMEKLAIAISEHKGKLLFSAGEVCYLTLKQKGVKPRQLLENIKNLLNLIK